MSLRLKCLPYEMCATVRNRSSLLYFPKFIWDNFIFKIKGSHGITSLGMHF